MKKIKVILMIVVLGFAVACCSCTNKEEKQIETATREEMQEVSSKDGFQKDEPEIVEPDLKDDETKDEQPKIPEYNLSKIKEEIVSQIGASDRLDFNENAIYALYSIDVSDIKQCAGFSVMEGTFPHEVVMIEAADDEAAARIEKAFEIKINSFAEQSKNYDAENYALAQKCKIQKNGRFYAMFLSPDYEDIKGIYNKYIK